MRITEISFCDKIGYNIRSDETKKYILDHIEAKYNIKVVAKHFEKFDENRSLNILNNNPHLACVRSNGNPYYLFITKHNYNEIAVFIDKKVQQGYFLPRMIIAHIMLGKDPKFHEGTMFDGEMVKMNNGKWVFLINDLLVYQGQMLGNMNLVKRINLVYDILDKEYVANDMSPFQIAVKTFFTFDELKNGIDDHIKSLPYTCRGIYFKPLFLKFKDILLNFDDTLIKKVKRDKIGGTFLLNVDKPEAPQIQEQKSNDIEVMTDIKNESCTFSTRKTSMPDVYELIDSTGGIVGIACVQSLRISSAMRELFADKTLVDRININFVFNEKFKKWVPQVC